MGESIKEVVQLFPSIIKSYEIIFKELKPDFSKTKTRIIITNETILYVREVFKWNSLLDYSYQWQTLENKLIIRWDNTAHHPHISTHPHHKHIELDSNIFPSDERNLLQVLSFIKLSISP